MRKRIVSRASLDAFLRSPTHQALVEFIEALNAQVVGVPLTTDDCHVGPAVGSTMQLLDTIESFVASHPPESGSASRFGNPAFRGFYDQVAKVRTAAIRLVVRP